MWYYKGNGGIAHLAVGVWHTIKELVAKRGPKKAFSLSLEKNWTKDKWIALKLYNKVSFPWLNWLIYWGLTFNISVISRWCTWNWWSNEYKTPQRKHVINLKVLAGTIYVNRATLILVKLLSCVKYLITMKIQSSIELEWFAHTCLYNSRFDFCGCINLQPVKRFIHIFFLE